VLADAYNSADYRRRIDEAAARLRGR
jgi:hypothetical protein